MATAPNTAKIAAGIERYQALKAQIAALEAMQTAAGAGKKAYILVDGEPNPVQISEAAAGQALFEVRGPLVLELNKLTTALNTAAAGMPA